MNNFDRREPGVPRKRELSMNELDNFVGRRARLNRRFEGPCIQWASAKVILEEGATVYVASRDPFHEYGFLCHPVEDTVEIGVTVMLFKSDLDFPEEKLKTPWSGLQTYRLECPLNFGGLVEFKQERKTLKVRDAVRGVVEVTKVFPGDVVAEEKDLGINEIPTRMEVLRVSIDQLLAYGEVKLSPMQNGSVFVAFFPRDCGALWLYKIGEINEALEGVIAEAQKLKIIPVN